MNIPPMIPVPEGASDSERLAMFEEYKSELIRINPGIYNEDGSVKTILQRMRAHFK